ncbi:response regulator [Methanomethylovorans sp.]|uniref:response regulator n=2 Tax=Methanomethylovorans sp. TaxID=2758717 RepID=UPI000A4D4BBE|nr:response regulator [Methanomethylovorans sp.]
MDNLKPRFTILVVDDEQANVELLEAYLHFEYDVITAFNGFEAIENARKKKPDLILLDIMMPDINGFEVCKVLKGSKDTAHIPIIMVTALSNRDDRAHAIEVGTDDFLSKPVDRLSLKTRVNSLLRLKALQDEILRERDQAQNYLDVAGAMFLVLDTEKHVKLINRKGCEILGYTEEEVIGKNWVDHFIPAYLRDEVNKRHYDLITSSIPANTLVEDTCLTRQGTEKVIRWNTVLLRNTAGNIIGTLSSGEDITSRKEAENRLQEYARDLKRSNELKDLFIDIMSHDILNPAGVARGFTEILQSMETDQDKLHKLGIVEKSISKILDTITSAANLARLESAEEIEFMELDLNSMILEAIDAYKHEILATGLKIEYRESGPYYAKANPLIGGVIMNLLSNALKYGSKGEKIIIKVEDADKEWKVVLTDFGCGISDADKSSVFQRFKRLTVGDIQGYGLGLAIVKRTIDLHGGRVGVENNPDASGTQFWFTVKKGLVSPRFEIIC